MYKQKRLELSKKYKMTRISRTKLRDYRGHEGEAKYLVGKYTDITSPRVVQERRNIIGTFPNAVIDVNKYNGIDQGQNGACSMVAIFNGPLMFRTETSPVNILANIRTVRTLISQVFIAPFGKASRMPKRCSTMACP